MVMTCPVLEYTISNFPNFLATKTIGLHVTTLLAIYVKHKSATLIGSLTSRDTVWCSSLVRLIYGAVANMPPEQGH